MSGISLRRPYPVLDPADVRQIRDAALEGLERIGVHVGTAKGRRLLAEAGADVEERSRTVRIPESLVKAALQESPSHVRLLARNPEKDLDLDLAHVHLCNDGTGCLVVDGETGERRPSTSEDLARSTLLSNALENHHVLWPMVTSQDAPGSVRDYVDLKVCYMNTDKPILFASATNAEQARRLRAMAAAVAGGEEEFRRRPILSSVHTSIAPLQHDGGNMDGAFVFGEAQMPVAIFTMPTPGASGPVTLAGSVTVAAMEFLSGLVMARLANPGCPLIWGCGVAPLDMRTTTRASGSPEHGLTGGAITQVAHLLGVPSLCGGFDSTAAVPGTQSAMEALTSGFSVLLGGADLIVGLGLIEDAKTLSLEHLVIADEMVSMIRRIAEGIVVNEETIALDVIERVGIGRSFLAEKHTLRHFRGESFMPRLMDRRSADLWAADGRRSVEARARDRIREALARPPPSPLAPSVVRALDEIIRSAAPIAASA